MVRSAISGATTARMPASRYAEATAAIPSCDGPRNSTVRSKQAVHPLRIISAADSAALRYLSFVARARVLAPAPVRNISSETLSSTAPRLSAPCEWVWALIRPGISRRSCAATTSASPDTVKPGLSIATIKPSLINISCSDAWPSPWRTRPPRMMAGRSVMAPRVLRFELPLNSFNLRIEFRQRRRRHLEPVADGRAGIAAEPRDGVEPCRIDAHGLDVDDVVVVMR